MQGKRYNRWVAGLFLELVIVLALLPACFRREELVDSFRGEDIAGLVAQKEDSLEFSGRELTLLPGVYQVRIWTALAEGQRMYVQMGCGVSAFKALRNNGMYVFPGNDYDDFDVFVADRVSGAYVDCDFYGADTLALVRLEVYKTNMGSRMLLFSVAVFFVVLDFLVGFRRRILEGRAERKQQVVFWALSAGVFLACFPYLTDYFFIGADSIFHYSRIAYLADALRGGVLPPVRVEGTWLYGHGYASPLFYGDLFLYIPAFLRLIGFSVMSAYKMYVFLVLAATAGIAYHSFRRCVEEEYAALFGALVYLLVPYQIFNTYSRGAVGEFTARTFLPLVCCGVYLLYAKDVSREAYKKYKWYVVWGMSGILQSHLITAEMSAVLMAAVCAVCWRKTFRKQTFFQLAEAAGIVLAVNAWFWMPMLFMMNADTYHLDKVIQEKGQSRGVLFAGLFQLLPNKGSGQTGMWNCEPVQIGAGTAMLLLLYVLWRFRRKAQGKGGGGSLGRICGMLALSGAALIFMSTRYFPWDALSEVPGIGYIVSSLQFPSRWMSPASVVSSMFAAFFFRLAGEEGGRRLRAAVGAAATVALFSAVYHVDSILYDFGPCWLYNEENMGTVGVVNGEYLLDGTRESDFSYHKPVAEEGLAWSEYEKKGTDVEIMLENISREIRYIEIPLTGYRGYGVKSLESGDVPSISKERGAHGDLRLEVPAGYRGAVRISYEGFPLFRMAEGLSLFSLSLLLTGVKNRRRVQAGKSRRRREA